MFGNIQQSSKWKRQLDRFVKEHQQELAALAWGLWLENGARNGTLGINLKPTPHFVYCSKESIEMLNDNVENTLQEVLGVVDAHNPEKEVLFLGIGNEQINLIQFEADPSPPVCFEQVATDVDTLIQHLEAEMSKQISG